MAPDVWKCVGSLQRRWHSGHRVSMVGAWASDLHVSLLRDFGRIRYSRKKKRRTRSNISYLDEGEESFDHTRKPTKQFEPRNLSITNDSSDHPIEPGISRQLKSQNSHQSNPQTCTTMWQIGQLTSTQTFILRVPRTNRRSSFRTKLSSNHPSAALDISFRVCPHPCSYFLDLQNSTGCHRMSICAEYGYGSGSCESQGGHIWTSCVCGIGLVSRRAEWERREKLTTDEGT